MEIIPAIDLIGGKCVRLHQGDFDAQKTYDVSPHDMLARYVADGAKWVHIVDLEGAKAGYPIHTGMIAELVESFDIKVQTAGGIRSTDHLDKVMASGATRVLIGSLAVSSPDETANWLAQYGGDKLGLAVDVRVNEGVPMAATSGWTESSGKSLWQVLDHFMPLGLKHVLVTDISRDGALQGQNHELMAEVTTCYPDLNIQASGGVASLEDITSAKAASAAGVILGRALYEGRLTVAEAIAVRDGEQSC